MNRNPNILSMLLTNSSMCASYADPEFFVNTLCNAYDKFADNRVSLTLIPIKAIDDILRMDIHDVWIDSVRRSLSYHRKFRYYSATVKVGRHNDLCFAVALLPESDEDIKDITTGESSPEVIENTLHDLWLICGEEPLEYHTRYNVGACLRNHSLIFEDVTFKPSNPIEKLFIESK